MELGDSFNVDDYKMKNDSSTEWKLRRRFLLAFHDQFPIDRLLCLANCYINSECYGNRYPAPVMRQLAELMKDLPPDDSIADISHRSKTKVAFVKAAENEGGPSRKQEEVQRSIFDAPVANSKATMAKNKAPIKFVRATDSSPSADLDPPVAKNPKLTPSKGMNFVKAADSYQSTDLTENESTDQAPATSQSSRNPFDDEEMKKFYSLSGFIREATHRGKNAIETIHMAADKARMMATSVTISQATFFVCVLKVDFVCVAKGQATSKKTAKHNSYENAIEVLRKPYLRVVKNNPNEPVLESSHMPFSDQFPGVKNPQMKVQNTPQTKASTGVQRSTRPVPAKQNIHSLPRSAPRKHQAPRTSNLYDLSNFLLIEPMHKNPGMRASTLIANSAAVNKVQFESTMSDEGNEAICTMTLGGIVIAYEKGPADTPNNLKSDTADVALAYLRSVCWTIQTKQTADTDDDKITHEELLGSIKTDLQIGNSNIGNQLLKKMGWAGGGLGKKGNEGIEEPITAANVINREGLGLRAEMGIQADFLPRMKDSLQQYTRSNKQTDLVFAPNFTKEERALIHQEARKFGLKSRSHGTGEERYLILSRKRSAGELFDHVVKSGGETSKYVLLPPGSVQADTST